MRCPSCGSVDDLVRETRTDVDQSLIRRRRQCQNCSSRWTTYERADSSQLVVRKSDGRREPFDSAKLRRGVAAATENLPFNEEDVDDLVNSITAALRPEGNEITSRQIGESAESELSVRHEIAFIRFASVFRRFQSASDFDSLIDNELRDRPLAVEKRNGRLQAFNRNKIASGIRWAVNQTKVEADAEAIAEAVIADVTAERTPEAAIPSSEIGESVMRHLRDRDPVAFLRFASVFERFESSNSFKTALAALRADSNLGDATGQRST